MKASELRIGNWFIEKGDVKQFDGDFYHLLGCEPIPLNTKWLEKFGFKKSKVSSQFDKEKLTIQVSNELERHKKGRVYFNSWAILEESIKYVHQLQNLYFALTGEELTFKSE